MLVELFIFMILYVRFEPVWQSTAFSFPRILITFVDLIISLFSITKLSLFQYFLFILNAFTLQQVSPQ